MNSTIDPSVPASGSGGISAPVRNNFAAAKADIETLALSSAPTISHQTPTTGGTLTASASLGCYELEPAGTIAALTIVTPSSPVDTQIFEVTTTQTITALTINPAAGQTVKGGGAMTLTANGGIGFRYRAADLTWRRRW